MRRNLLLLSVIALFAFSIISCGSENNERNDNTSKGAIKSEETTEFNEENELGDAGFNEEEKNHLDALVEVEEAEKNNENSTTTAKFIEATAFEGEATFVFQEENGSKIEFNRIMSNSEFVEPELKYGLIGDDGMSANKEYVGATFKIIYKLEKDGCWNIDGDKVDCNKIKAMVLTKHK